MKRVVSGIPTTVATRKKMLMIEIWPSFGFGVAHSNPFIVEYILQCNSEISSLTTISRKEQRTRAIQATVLSMRLFKRIFSSGYSRHCLPKSESPVESYVDSNDREKSTMRRYSICRINNCVMLSVRETS